MRVFLICLLVLAVDACAHPPEQSLEPQRPDAAIYSYLKGQYPGLHLWQIANVTGPLRTQGGLLFDADVRCQPWSDRAEDWLPSTAWSHHRFLINGIVRWAEPPIEDPIEP